MPEIEVSRFPDPAGLEIEWRALEPEAAPGFFQSWTWLSCLYPERFPEAVLLRAREGGRTVGLALFNAAGGRLALGESGDPALDAPFIEHNAPLVAENAPPGLAEAMLRHAWAVPGIFRLVLHGVPSALAGAAGGVAVRQQQRLAPFVDLETVRGAGGDYLKTLSANTRQQGRRSLRHYAARGELVLAAASGPDEAQAWLKSLVGLHTASWQSRGKPGAFSTPYLMRFHETLVALAFARGELELLRLSAGEEAIGYLYNFRLGGRVFAYQSGFRHEPDTAHARPGLCCHALAIERALAAGERVYDFLAGADRYKLSLANGSEPMEWVELARPGTLDALAAAAKNRLRGWLGRD